jgi:hypothetical protein
MLFDLTDLRLFIFIAELKSLTQAAERTHLSLAANNRVKEMEARESRTIGGGSHRGELGISADKRTRIRRLSALDSQVASAIPQCPNGPARVHLSALTPTPGCTIRLRPMGRQRQPPGRLAPKDYRVAGRPPPLMRRTDDTRASTSAQLL